MSRIDSLSSMKVCAHFHESPSISCQRNVAKKQNCKRHGGGTGGQSERDSSSGEHDCLYMEMHPSNHSLGGFD